MPRARIIIVHLPIMLREIVKRSVELAPDIDVIGEYENLEDASTACSLEGVRVIVAGLNQPTDRSDLRRLLACHPGVRALALTGAGKHGELWWCMPQEVPLGEMSTASLLDAIRAASGPRPVLPP